MKQDLVKRSKFLSLVLRHNPSAAQVELDREGWVDVDVLLDGCSKSQKAMTWDQLKEVVETNNKRRFAFSEDGKRIRASQGHSLEVDLAMKAIEPPAWLYHGTATRFIQFIQQEGIKKMNRQHVHLSADNTTATQVGSRHGKVTVLSVNTGKMYQDGYKFFQSENGVWLTDNVPARYINFK